MNMLGYSISKNGFILGAFACITAGILAATFLFTYDRIRAAEILAAEKALLEIIPRERHDNNMLHDLWPIPEADLKQLGLQPGDNIHLARQNGQVIAVIIPSLAADGYSGDIKMIIGINLDGSLAGVRILSHKETPGLGDKIDLNKHAWILSFDGKSLNNPALEKWQVKKDGGEFDQFTGATITPRAVVNRVKQTLQWFAQNQQRIVQPGSAASNE